MGLHSAGVCKLLQEWIEAAEWALIHTVKTDHFAGKT